jgi:hypothetical protein
LIKQQHWKQQHMNATVEDAAGCSPSTPGQQPTLLRCIRSANLALFSMLLVGLTSDHASVGIDVCQTQSLLAAPLVLEPDGVHIPRPDGTSTA